jgi:ElaB/YqjD/DUF883 family membrane-anchored ribosome-binding protein
MSNDPSPLKYMGTQSRETMTMAEAMALDSGSDVAAAGSRIGDAASWAMGKAKDGLQSAAEQVRERATTAVATYTRDDPIRAILIAAGVGALLMSLVAMMARSGVRTVRRNVRRYAGVGWRLADSARHAATIW